MNTFRMDTARETKSNSGVMLPVVELVIAIGLFTIISIFIVKFFTSANTMSRQADELSKGLIKAEAAIELTKALSPKEAAKELGGKLEESEIDKLIEVYYDKDWKVTDLTGNFKYILTVMITDTTSGNGTLSNIHVTINTKDDDTVITNLKGSKYIKGGR
nr:hypothetical protein [uncultured Catonella sp.]